MSAIQLVGLRISLLRNLSVKKEPAGFGWVGVEWFLDSKEEGPRGCPAFPPAVSAGLAVVFLGGLRGWG